jgi:Na+-translocating ferredoxin:NAD+ oxidoreductase RnfE subunit
MKNMAVISMQVFIGLLATTIAHANPTLVQIVFTCPSVTGNSFHALNRTGKHIVGYGKEMIIGKSSAIFPYFSYEVPPQAHIPVKLALGSYANNGTHFDTNNSMISCNYLSATSFDAFSVNYIALVYPGAFVANQTFNTITIHEFIGLK